MYALDLLTSATGPSWMKDRRWDFASSRIARHRGFSSRTAYTVRGVVSIIMFYCAVDILDTCIKGIPFDTLLRRPVTDALPLSQQLFCGVVVGMWAYIYMSLYYTLFATSFVALRFTAPSSWPPLYKGPLFASSVQDFWSVRWHLFFRQCFTRLGNSLLSAFFTVDDIKASKGVVRVARVWLAFVMSTLLHLIIMHRHPPDPDHPHHDFWDWSIMAFFLSQPLGIALDGCLVYAGAGSRCRRLFAWVWFLWTSRWWADVWVKKGLWDRRTERFVFWSPSRGILFGDWWADEVVYI